MQAHSSEMFIPQVRKANHSGWEKTERTTDYVLLQMTQAVSQLRLSGRFYWKNAEYSENTQPVVSYNCDKTTLRAEYNYVLMNTVKKRLEIPSSIYSCNRAVF